MLGSRGIQKILFLKNRIAFQSQGCFSKSIIKHYKKTGFWCVSEDQREMESKSGASLTSRFLLEGRFGLALCTVTVIPILIRDPAGSSKGAGPQCARGGQSI